MASYDKHYQKREYFGNAYPELISYMSTLDNSLKVLDLGCGQGRDAIAIGRLGFSVTGVDVSKVGIQQMNQVAAEEGLDITGIVSDLNQFDHLSKYDIILLDSMFHFYKNDIEKETETLQGIITESKENAYIIVIMQESKDRVDQIKNIINTSSENCHIAHEESFIYKEFDSMFYMIVISKNKN